MVGEQLVGELRAGRDTWNHMLLTRSRLPRQFAHQIYVPCPWFDCTCPAFLSLVLSGCFTHHLLPQNTSPCVSIFHRWGWFDWNPGQSSKQPPASNLLSGDTLMCWYCKLNLPFEAYACMYNENVCIYLFLQIDIIRTHPYSNNANNIHKIYIILILI